MTHLDSSRYRQTAILSLLLAAGVFMISPPASAEQPDYSRPGLYASLGGVYAVDLYEDEVSDALDGVNVDVDATGGLNARVGLRFLKVLALEVQYEWLDAYDIEIELPAFAQTATVELEQHTLTANLRLFIPLARVQPYFLAGIGFQLLDFVAEGTLFGTTFDEKRNDTVLAGRLGAGFEVYVTEHVALFAEGLVVLTNEELDLPIAGAEIENIFYAGASAGLTYRF